MSKWNNIESWALKNWCFWTVCWGRLESHLDWKEIQPVHPKGNQSWIFIRRTDAKAKTQILQPPDVKNWLFGKDPGAGKYWGQEKTGMTEDEIVVWHHQLDGHELEQAPGVGDGEGSLACCSPWGRKESDNDWATELNWTELEVQWLRLYVSTAVGMGSVLVRKIKSCMPLSMFKKRERIMVSILSTSQEWSQAKINQ